jgi:hypothetical protein
MSTDHAVYAITEAGDRVRVSAPMPYADALNAWHGYQSTKPREAREEYRVTFASPAGGVRGPDWVRHFDVRAVDHYPYVPHAHVVEHWSRPYKSDTYAAKHALHRLGRGYEGRPGGWIYRDGTPVGQGWVSVAKTRGVRFTYVGRSGDGSSVVAPGDRYLIGVVDA